MRATIVTAAVLSVLLPVLAVVQYRWLDDLTRAERVELRASLEARTEAIARACDDVVTGLYAALQSSFGEDADGEVRVRLAHRYSAWASEVRHSDLIRKLYLVEARKGEMLSYEYDPALHEFRPGAWLPSLGSADLQFDSGAQPQLPTGAFLIPLPPGPQNPFRPTAPEQWAVAVMDTEFLAKRFLPGAIQQAFGSPVAASLYQIDVLSSDGKVVYSSRPAATASGVGQREFDTSTALFRVRPHILADVMRPRSSRRQNRSAAIGVGVVGGFHSRAGDVAGSRQEPFRMTVRHTAGSVEAAVAAIRKKNLAIAFTIEAILATSIALLVVSSARARATLERQMAFVAGFSHDMRTPVAVIRTLAHNQKRGLVKGSAQVERYGAAILQHAARLADSVEQALHFAGVRAGRISRQSESVDVGELLRLAASETTAALPDTSRAIHADLAADLPRVRGDAAALRCLFQNLLVNAVKYSDPGSAIAMTARRVNSSVEISVEDHGWGIPVREQARIFRPFFRARAARESRIPGTGLGLALVKAIVEEHRGGVSCKSKPGHGSIFTVRLPIDPDRAAPTEG